MSLSNVFFGILAIVSGLLASSNFVLERFPSAKKYLEKIRPYQTTIGIIALIVCILKGFDLFSSREGFLSNLITFFCIFSCSIIGFLLGYPILLQWIVNNEKFIKNTEDFRKKLLPWQVLAGIVAIITGILVIIVGLLPNNNI